MSASPEGEVWFLHDTLRQMKGFDPTNDKQFYSTIFLEVATNAVWKNKAMTVHRSGGRHTGVEKTEHISSLPLADSHPRAGKQTWDPEFRSWYERYKFLTVMTGPSPDKITAHKQSHGQGSTSGSSPSSISDHQGGLSLDRPHLSLRGIYIPKLKSAHPKYTNYCRYSRLNFRARDVTVKTDSGKTITLKPDSWMGWGLEHAKWTARLDIFAIDTILAMPDHLLKKEYTDPYQFIQFFSCENIQLKRIGPDEGIMSPGKMIEWDWIMSNEHGVNATYKKNGFDQLWAIKMLIGLAAVGAGTIPMIGPLVSVGVQLVGDALTDPQSFCSVHSLLSAKAPGVATGLTGYAMNVKGFVKLPKTSSIGTSTRGGASGEHINKKTEMTHL
ncbi:hypothetical protein N7488_000787 [Penicillium malachiteum]|nr:hypothetical protein N7488_000787 [Penicillium malachiteum]